MRMASFWLACSPWAKTGMTTLVSGSARPISSSVWGTSRRSWRAICVSTCWRSTPSFSAVATLKRASRRSSERLSAPIADSVAVIAAPRIRRGCPGLPPGSRHNIAIEIRKYRDPDLHRGGQVPTRSAGAEAAARGGLGVLGAGLREAALVAQLAGAALGAGGVLPVQLVPRDRVLGEDVDARALPELADVQEAAVDRDRD